MADDDRARLEGILEQLHRTIAKGARLIQDPRLVHVDYHAGSDVGVLRTLADTAKAAVDLGNEADIRRALAYVEHEIEVLDAWIELRSADGAKSRH